jgi:hypothetical protein
MITIKNSLMNSIFEPVVEERLGRLNGLVQRQREMLAKSERIAGGTCLKERKKERMGYD